MTEPDLLTDLRRPTFAIAYRMLGTSADAEDIVQETLLRVQSALDSGEQIESPRAFAATIATRLSIDELRSARVRREQYVGEWLPEPLVRPEGEDPADQAELADSLSLAFLVLLESLSPEQRAALLLHDVFDYSYGEIAEIVGKSESNARQLAARARRHVSDRKPRFDSSREQREQLADRFFAAAMDGEVRQLEQLLAKDVELHGDGGGKVPALARSLHGVARVARTLVAWGKAGRKYGATTIRRVEVNGQPGALWLNSEGDLVSVMALDISVVNPEKLAHVDIAAG